MSTTMEERKQEAVNKIVDYLDKHKFEQQEQSNILARCIAEVVKRSRRNKA